MCIRTETGFDYGHGEFVTFDEAIQELTDSLVDADDEPGGPLFTREEHEENARAIIESCEDGAYL